MTYLVAMMVYGWIYLVMYLGPGLVLVALSEIAPWLSVLKFPVGIAGFVLAGFRAKMAAECYGERDMGFCEAHTASGYRLKIALAMLPFVGKLFGGKKQKNGRWK